MNLEFFAPSTKDRRASVVILLAMGNRTSIGWGGEGRVGIAIGIDTELVYISYSSLHAVTLDNADTRDGVSRPAGICLIKISQLDARQIAHRGRSQMAAAHRRTALLVEDNEPTRVGFAVALGREGYLVATAPNGAEAMRLLSEGLRPDVIVLDLMLPVMSGFEFRQQQMAAAPEIASIPVVVYSATTDAKENAAHLKAVAYLQKPVDPQSLMNELRNLFQQSQPLQTVATSPGRE